MSFIDTVGEDGLAILSRYVMQGAATEAETKALAEIAEAASGQMDIDMLETVTLQLRTAREDHGSLQAAEAASALVARAICMAKLADPNGEVEKDSANWLSRNVTAASVHQDRVRGIWRAAAGLGDDLDTQFFEHALESARLGKTIQPAPRADTQTPGDTGTEDKMFDPTPIRDEILEKLAFNPAGLPPSLRDSANQKIYVDAVVTSVALLGHGPNDGDDAAVWSAATAALMLLDGHYNPQDSRFFAHAQKAVAELSGSAAESGTVAIDSHKSGQVDDDGNDLFIQMTAPDPKQTQRIGYFVRAWKIIQRKLAKGDKAFFQSLAVATRKAVDTYSEHLGDLTLLTPTVDAAYNGDVASGGSGGGGGVANVDLPPLNDPAGYNDEIERENIRAVSTIYVGYQLEFAIKACARILELFVAGLLPIPASDGSARVLDNLYWDQDDLLDEGARRSIYARVLGAPGGELAFDIQPNTEFNTLLMRSVSAVAEYERQRSLVTQFDNAARGRRFQLTSGEFVRKAVRDFAANVSLRGWAGTAFTAERMARQIKQVMKVLGLPAVRTAFGVTTPWQVIERVSQREFGITVNTVLHRTLAVETQSIMSVIAENHTVWSQGAVTPLFSDTQANEGDLSYADSVRLVNAAQHFRAVTGIGDGLIDEYSEPVETHAAPSLPDLGGMSGMGGMGGGAMPPVDMTGVNALRDLVNSGQTPSPDQILSMLPRL
ncbi:hypothetical protein [Ruegeria hyattellae]|uniref:hypothetical protein n=1 Tax=Ruegeria hyattellae TaxID=3233337 RepID=UPI00355B9A9E